MFDFTRCVLFCVRPDIDECADGNNGGCSEVCTNTEGSFECSCSQSGYELDEGNEEGPCIGECTLLVRWWEVESVVKLSIDEYTTSEMLYTLQRRTSPVANV